MANPTSIEKILKTIYKEINRPSTKVIFQHYHAVTSKRTCDKYLERELPLNTAAIQCAAVRTVRWVTREPPQTKLLINSPLDIATMWGWLPGAAWVPPTMRALASVWSNQMDMSSSGVGRAGIGKLSYRHLYSLWRKQGSIDTESESSGIITVTSGLLYDFILCAWSIGTLSAHTS